MLYVGLYYRQCGTAGREELVKQLSGSLEVKFRWRQV